MNGGGKARVKADPPAPEGAASIPVPLAEFDFELIRHDGLLACYRGLHRDGKRAILLSQAASSADETEAARQLDNEFSLRNLLDDDWSLRPRASLIRNGRPALVYDDAPIVPLDRQAPWLLDIGGFLEQAIRVTAALRRAHESGLLHRNIKPSNIIFDPAGACRLSGFGLAVRAGPGNAEGAFPLRSGTLAYMSPEHTGRTRRGADARSDLYSLGVTLYETLTGRLPFRLAAQADANEWMHRHLAVEPEAPRALLPSIPPMLSALILRLLAKDPACRYQSAAALEADLHKCLAAWRATLRIDDFALGLAERAQLRFDGQLHGRENELRLLLQCWERTRTLATRVRVRVRGSSGVGKSALLSILHGELRRRVALVAAGKADQYHKSQPYAALAEAMDALVMDIIAREDSEVRFWRDRLLQALGGYGRIALAIVPQLELLTGALPDVPELPAQEAQIRFHAVMRRLFASLASDSAPLVLLLDDAQWIDAPAMQLLDALMTGGEDMPLLLVTAWRTENDDKHADDGPGTEPDIDLRALGVGEVAQMLADALAAPIGDVHPLAVLVHGKTNGNPLFVRQFLQAVADEGMLVHDPAAQRWEWDIARLRDCDYTDNVAAAVLQRISRLPMATQRALAVLAQLGRHASEALLAAVTGTSVQDMRARLAPAVDAEVLLHTGDEYRFCHDRVQEAAHVLLDEHERRNLHLAAARALLAHGRNGSDEQLFRACEHVLGALDLVTGKEEREVFARAGLDAARRARHAAAPPAALAYVAAALELADRTPPLPDVPLICQLLLEQAECRLLAGQLGEADDSVRRVLAMPATPIDRAGAYRIKTEIHLRRSENALAVETALQGLAELGLSMSPRPREEECDAAYRQIRALLGDDPEDMLLALPPATDPQVDAVMALLSVLTVPASFTSDALHFLQLCHMLRLTVEHGMSGPSTAALAWFGVLVGHRYSAYEDGFRYGRLARELVRRNDYRAYEAKTILALDQLSVWTQPLTYSVECARAGFDAGLANGDITTACFECCHQVANLLTRGDHLDTVKAEAEQGLRFVGQAQFRDVQAILSVQRQHVDNLRTGRDGRFSGDAVLLPRLDSGSGERMSTLIFWFWLYKGISHYLAGEARQSLTCMDEAEKLAWSAPGHIHLLDYHLYHALAIAAVSTPADDDAGRLARLRRHCDKLSEWADVNPASFADKAWLAAGELARLQDDGWSALRHFSRAIDHAGQNGFVQYAALGHELAARLCCATGLQTAADAHLTSARDAYRRWGALAKAQSLESRHPLLLQPQPAGHQATVSLSDSADSRDLISVVRSMRALSEELQLDSLVRTLMTIAIQHAGAQRVLLLRLNAGTPLVTAHAETGANGVQVTFAQQQPTAADLPLSMLQTSLRTARITGVAGAARPPAFETDPYLRDKPRCAAMCVPMQKRGELTGILYLENRLMPDAFSPEQVRVLQIIAAQAAVSLEIATLYADLVAENQQRRSVERTLRASEASLELGEQISHTGSWRWDVSENVLDCSAGFNRILGMDESRRRIDFSEFVACIHPDDRSIVLDAVFAGRRERRPIRVEYRILLADGTVRHLAGVGRLAADAGGEADDYVGTVTDITERRASEDALRISQAELARVARAATVGQLTASIAHEINQPLMSIVSNAGATLRWLDRDPPELEEARIGLRDVVSEAGRAGHIIRSLQALTRNTEPALERIDLHATVRHILAICRSELEKRSVSVMLALDAPDAGILADGIQIQQVLLNLVGNAIDAMSDVGERPRILSVASLIPAPGIIRVSLEDNGIGVNASDTDRIFDAFYTTKNEGMGMGLAISRSIVEAHQGRLYAAPAARHGSVFTLELPLQARS